MQQSGGHLLLPVFAGIKRRDLDRNKAVMAFALTVL